MSIHRYTLAAATDGQLARQVTSGVSVVGRGVAFIDIDLTNDADLSDLTAFMEFLGSTFVQTAPTTSVASIPGLSTGSFEGTETTADATFTTVATQAITDGRTLLLEAHVSGRRAGADEGAGFVLRGAFRRTGGAVTQIGSTQVINSFADDSTWNAQFLVSGTDVLVQVKGAAAASVDWRCVGTVVSS